MKKLTEKDAIWCKTQKQWEKVLKFLGTKNNFHFYEKGVTDVILVGGGICSLHTANHHKHPVHKAKDILKKSFKKDVLKRLEKIEKVISDKTSVNFYQTQNYSTEPLKFDLPTKELEELPEKWCVKISYKNLTELNRYLHNNKEKYIGYKSKWDVLEIDGYFMSENKERYGNYHSCNSIEKGYTEITFDQFKKWVLKEEENTVVNTDTTLSIREVQVKVSNQQEANECAEIAKACGEKVSGLNIYNSCCYFVFFDDNFSVAMKKPKKKEISIQEYRERFGKPATEIDWSKAGQLVCEKDDELLILLTNGIHKKNDFEAITLVPRNKEAGINDFKGEYWTRWNKDNFKLCTEPITIKNE